MVKHWLINNTIRKDRYNETKHLDEKRALVVKENGSYTELSRGLTSGNHLATQKRIEEDRIEEKRRVSARSAEETLKKAVKPPKIDVTTGEVTYTQGAYFEMFWKVYPKKVGKLAAMKAWFKIRPSKELCEKIVEAVAQQISSEQWIREGGRFIPHPATWLNQGRWDDEIITNSTKVHKY